MSPAPVQFSIDIQGEERFAQMLREMGPGVSRALIAAGKEAAANIVSQKGVKQYPPATAANQAGRMRTVVIGGRETTFRAPWYKRGLGTQQPMRGGGYRSLNNSERLGTQYVVESRGTNTVIGNRASYAPFVSGEDQAKHMARIGWRKLSDVVREQMGETVRIYTAWMDRLIAEKGS